MSKADSTGHDPAAAMTVMGCLKSSTDQQHRNLESVTPLSRLFAPDYTIPEYSHLLQSFLAIMEPLECLLQRYDLLDHEGYQYLPRSPDIHLDLGHIGFGSRHNPIVLPDYLVRSQASAIGCLYVLEGSRLGGKLIARHLQQSTELTREHGLAFFYGHPQLGPSSWESFAQIAEKTCRSPDSLDAACATARMTFDVFLRGLKND